MLWWIFFLTISLVNVLLVIDWKKQTAHHLSSLYKGSPVNIKFEILCFSGFLKADGSKVVPVSPAFLKFENENGDLFHISEVEEITFVTLKDDHVLFIPSIKRVLFCNMIEIFKVHFICFLCCRWILVLLELNCVVLATLVSSIVKNCFAGN